MKYLIVLAILLFANHVSANTADRVPEGKFLSMFNIVRFPNDHCDAGGSRNGTCYTKEECSNKGGTEDGSCASGYGVCCTFVANCGAVLSENNTYFESEGEEDSHCSIQVCKGKDNIVQLRLDFITFVINGPITTVTTTDVLTIAGVSVATGAGGVDSSLASRCLTDTFSVSNPGGPSPPQICGTATDEHMYVDMGADCVDLTFQLGTGTRTVADPQWTIRVTQYDSGYTNLAPFGCTQYFWKQDSDSDGKGTIQSYNWQGGSGYHLADQKQVICIRREDDMKKICYGVAALTDFSVSGTMPITVDAAMTFCGGYNGAAGTGKYADAVNIPSALTVNSVTQPYSNLCGQSFAAALTTSICSKAVPFVVTFTSDSFEINDEALAGCIANPVTATGCNAGFRLYYEQKSS